MKIDAVIFDMDGTLVDSLFFWDYLWEKIGEDYLGDTDFTPDLEIDKSARTMIYTEAMELVRTAYNINTTKEDFLSYSVAKIEDFYKHQAKIKSGARELLEALTVRKIPLVLASGSEMKHILIALRKLDLEKYFTNIFSCNDIGYGKDRPDIYIAAIDSLGLSPERIAVVEDSLVALRSAKSLGVRTVGVYDSHNFGHDELKSECDVYIDEHSSLSSLIDVFEI